MIEALKEPFINGIGIGLGIGVVLLVARMVSEFLRGLFEKDEKEEP